MPVIPLDFSGVPERGSVRVPEGDYRVKVTNVEKTKSKSSGNPMLVVTLAIADGQYKGKKVKDNHVLTENSLWTLRNMLEAIGWKVKPSSMKLDTDKMLMNRMVGVSLIDGDEYKGRIKSEVADYIPVDTVDSIVRPEDDEADLDAFDEDEDEEEDFLEDDEDEEAEDDEEEEEDEEDDEDWEFDEDEDEEEEEEEEEEDDRPSESEIKKMKGKELKVLAKEWDVDIKGQKVKEAKATLIEALHGDEEEDDEEELEDFDLDDIE